MEELETVPSVIALSMYAVNNSVTAAETIWIRGESELEALWDRENCKGGISQFLN